MSFDKDIQKLEAEKKFLEQELEGYEERLEACAKEKKAIEDARNIMQLAARKTQENLEVHFSDLVSKALATVFDDPYLFVPKFEERRNKTECDLWFEKNKVRRRPRFSTGGGVIDITSFALRLAYNRLEKGAPVLVLDEPFKMLSKSLMPRAVALLHLLSREFGVQMIINSHIDELAQQADKVFEIEGGKLIGDEGDVR